MGVLLIAIAIGIALSVALGYFFGAIAGVLPGIAAFGVAYFFLSRRMNRVMEQGMMAVQKDLQRGQIENAVRHLEALKSQVGRMQLFASSTIDGQIGIVGHVGGSTRLADLDLAVAVDLVAGGDRDAAEGL